MNRFGPYPFVRILLPFLIGIISAVYFQCTGLFSGIIFFILFILYVLDFYRKNKFGEYSWRFVNGAYVMILLFFAGNFLVYFSDDRIYETHYSNINSKQNYYLIEISNEPQQKEKSVKAHAKLVSVMVNGKEKPADGKILMYFKKDEKSIHVHYGDRIIISGRLQEIPGPQNPGEFDYKLYCSNHEIYGQIYVDEFHWKKIGNESSFIYRTAYEVRSILMNVLRVAGLSGQEFAVASALLFGHTGEIDSETYQAYSASGALHVLSVSGLHVAIIYLVFDKILFFLLLFKRGKYFKAGIILILLWSYALLTGLSPSVVRSATMLSFIVMGKLINRNASPYNSMCAAAFLILWIEPRTITDIGFQLSYLAVFGIVYVHPKIYHLIYFKNRIPDFIWNITAVSIAAQLITFPISVFYFHQFPNYFLLANLFVIPLGTIILYLGVAALIFTSVPYVNEFLFYLLKWCVKALNESVYYTEQLPNSISDGIFISVFEMIFIYIIIFSILFYTDTRKVFWIKSTLLFSSVLLFCFSVEKYNNMHHKEWIVYSIPKETAFEISSGNHSIFYSSKKLLLDQKKVNYHIKNYRGINGIVEIHTQQSEFTEKNMYFKNGYFAFIGKTGVLIDKSFEPFSPRRKFKINYILISGNSKVKWKDLESMYEFDQVILDKSNSYYFNQRLKEESSNEFCIYDVSEMGAYRLTL